YTLGIHNGKVVVFEGSETGGEIYAETELDAGGLLPGDREVLEAGIIVESEAEIWQYLEGLEHGRS
ncbi:MAG: BofC C-terminal domain-containing protein, partial [Thermaerobacterales bacterium]